MKKVILFSSTGYVGSFIKERFLEERDICLIEINRGSNWMGYDENYDIFIYSACTRYADTSKYIEDNVIAAVSVVDFCKKHCIKRIIYLSSDAVYGNLNVKEVNSESIMSSPDLYGGTKYLAERIIVESGIPYYILRMPGIVGRVWGKAYLCRLMDQIKNNQNVDIYNSDKEFNNVLDIDDLTRFLVILSNSENKKSEIFVLGNMEKIKLLEMVNYIRELYNSTSPIKLIDAESKRYFAMNVDKAVQYGYLSKPLRSIIQELYFIQLGDNDYGK